MKKLVVLLVSLFILSAVFAVTPEVSWKGTASFTLGVDEKGLDVSGGLIKPKVLWSPSSDTQFGVSFGIDLVGKSLTLYSISFENSIFGLTYANGASAFQYFVGTDRDKNPLMTAEGNIAVTLKAVDGLTVVYQDILRTVDYNTGVLAGEKWFNDFVGLTYSVAGVNLSAAFYDADTASTTNTFEYGVNANTELDLGFGSLTLDGVFGMVDGANTTAYGISESFSAEFSILTLTQTFAWKENVENFEYAGDSSAKTLSVKAAVSYEMEPVTLGADATFKIGDLSSPTEFTVPVNLSLGFANDMVSANAKVSWGDIVAAATDLVVNADLSVTPVDAFTLSGAVKYLMDGNEFGYYAKASYAIDDNTTLCAFYGILYDKDGDGAADINKDDAQWYAKLSWSVSF
ncbi:hypothetical protein SU69_00935 [Thermosipho melanesiensis]|uniref:Uncharacterized protein n=2 Tax=Thermosipho melanesiensis TaxID=46541 RepID=A6LJF1_THEM4|nr:hypothetical protein [Thermosipho melanesiensis]ABR30052.1 hypothetical protein Tmel_0175 [Thermosipho melanesiensis BI429]APT73249.1 hypothetical protein BW47_00965 [Thermosipho melanesiensis]OOC38646.1 hypothetical protein SU68_00935 [Thermosipho melanesiensis]OOC40450.1 hypothetical protein SU70_00935 [Thermosipho melanesiensis]OOC40715.1 hypothetical protein SU69_00935 [Thermosipho melanesiensis]